MKTLERKDYPNLFIDIRGYEIDCIQNHRRGSNFFTESIVEFYKDENEYGIDGIWITNVYIWDDNYGHEDSEIQTLYKVEKKTKTVTNWVKL